MNEDRNGRPGVSRRVMLTGTVLAVGAAAVTIAIRPAGADVQKISQADAAYQGSPKDGQRCGVCLNYQAPNACKFVQGDINPSGWCQLFAPKSES